MNQSSLALDYLANHSSHIAELARWQHQEWAHLNPGETLEGRVARIKANSHVRQVPTVFVAIENNGLRGSASLVEHDMDTRMEWTPWLASVFVLPEHRKKGVASQLIRRVTREAAELNYSRLYLFTEHAQNLYARLGWRVVENTTYRGQPITVMSVDLAAQSPIA